MSSDTADTVSRSIPVMKSRYMAASRGTEAGELKTALRHRIIIAYRSDVRPDMRLFGDNTTYTTEAVLDVANRKEYLELQVRSE